MRDDFIGGSLTGQYNGMATSVAPRPFKPVSVFDKSQVVKNPNGRSQSDQGRTLVNGTPQSINGVSSTTFDTKSWIGSPYRTFGA